MNEAFTLPAACGHHPAPRHWRRWGPLASAAAITLLLASLAHADALDDLAGQWVGSAAIGGRTSAVVVTAPPRSPVPSTARYALRLGAPRNCTLEAELTQALPRGLLLTGTTSNGGYCDRLLDHALQLNLQGDDAAQLSFGTDGMQEQVSISLLRVPGARAASSAPAPAPSRTP